VVYQTQKNVFQKESQMKKALHPPKLRPPSCNQLLITEKREIEKRKE
jgi:hypothetical protein